MAYEIIKSDGTFLTSIPDGTLNTTSTPLQLPGRNYAGYGINLDRNLVWLLENFADTTPPSNPLRGQLWFNTNDSNLYICPSDGVTNANDWVKLITEGNANVSYENINVSGNIEANNINLFNLVRASSVEATIVYNGTSSLSIPVASGNINLSVSATPNVAVVTPSGLEVTGTLSVSSNISVENISANNGTFTSIAGSLTTAAQPNITSVGTLTNLSVTGNVTSNNISGNSLQGPLTTAAQPNITSVGTLTSLSVSGNADVGNVSANNGVFTAISGPLTTAAQPNITSLGTLSSLSATGNITGNYFIGNGNLLTGIVSTIAQTVTTNAQPNITSVGTLTTLSVSGDANVSNLAISGSYVSTQPSFRNKIINGDMSVLDNRLAYGGTANLLTPTTGFSRAFATDRWRYERLNTGGNISADLNQGNYTRVPGFPVYLGFTCNATVVTPGTNERSGVYQQIEPINTWDFGWGTSGAKPVTLSFWARSSVTGIFSGAVLGAGVTWSYVFNYTMNSANTWEFKTITIPGNTSGNWNNTTQPLTVYFSFAAGTAARTSFVNTWINAPRTCSTTALNPLATAGATYAITGVQLENSPVATPFEYRPIDVETRMCQKYFQGYTDPPLRGVFAGTGLGRVGMVLPTTMRTSPANEVSGTFNWYDGANTWTTTSLPTASYNTNRSIEYDFNTITGGGTIVTGRAAILYYNNSGTLRLDAEFSAFT